MGEAERIYLLRMQELADIEKGLDIEYVRASADDSTDYRSGSEG